MTHEPLPLRSAMHRDVPNGSRLEIANAYAVGELMTEAEWSKTVNDRFREDLDALTEPTPDGL